MAIFRITIPNTYVIAETGTCAYYTAEVCVYVLWVENLVSRVKKRKQTEGILGRYWGAAERKYRRLEKTR
jgi:hypothetical protein